MHHVTTDKKRTKFDKNKTLQEAGPSTSTTIHTVNEVGVVIFSLFLVMDRSDSAERNLDSLLDVANHVPPLLHLEVVVTNHSFDLAC